MALVLACGAHFTQNRKLNLRAAIVLWLVFALGFAGAVLSLLRAPDLDQSLWNTVGLGMNFVIMLLFMTTIATQHTRKALLLIIIGNGMLWTIQIQRMVSIYGTLAYSTFKETGSDKNAIGFFLALGAVALFYLCVFLKPKQPWRRWRLLAVRIALAVAGVWFFFNMSLIYARTALISAILGIGAIFCVFYMQTRKDHRVPVKPILYLTALVLLGISQVPRIVTISPRWTDMYEVVVESVSSGNIDEISESRTNLLRKGWTIVSDNPVLGVGVAGSRPAYSTATASFGVGLIHNSYLAEWADKGILGLIAYIVWLMLYVRIVRSMFWRLPNVDRLWLVLYVSLISMMASLDFTSVNLVFLAVLAGIYYEQVISAKKFKDRSC